MTPRFRLVSRIFESKSYPIVVHVFYGESEQEALGYYAAHQKTDRFLAGCKQGSFMRMRCREEAVLEEHVNGHYTELRPIR